jgi:hypothetical protein
MTTPSYDTDFYTWTQIQAAEPERPERFERSERSR